MNQCKRCDSTSVTYVTDYEHLDFDTDGYRHNNGWLCDDCECFHDESGNYYEFFSRYEDPCKVNYKQLVI